MSDMPLEDVKRKIKACLDRAAANSGASPNEAATAARMAQAMMKKYNLEASDIIFKDLQDKANCELRWVRATTRKNAPRRNDDTPLWAQILAQPVADLFDCQANMRKVNLRQGLCSVIAFYGYKVDVEVCAWTYEYLIDCVRRLGREYEDRADALAANGGAKSNREALDSFRFGCASEIANRVHQLVLQKKREEAGHKTGTALVVSKRQAIVEAFPECSFGPGESVDPSKNAVAMMAGRIAGSKVNIQPGKPVEDKS